jgi:alcohol dehydrogenase (cytochrome c)
MSYEVRNQQYVAVANNRAVWAFKLGGTLPPREAPVPPAVVREWAGQVATASSIDLGTVRTFTIASAQKKIDSPDDYGVSPARVRTKVGTIVTWTNKSTMPHTVSARDGSWTTGEIKPGGSGSATIAKAGTYEYICTEHPWTIGQLIVE